MRQGDHKRSKSRTVIISFIYFHFYYCYYIFAGGDQGTLTYMSTTCHLLIIYSCLLCVLYLSIVLLTSKAKLVLLQTESSV